VRDYQDFFAPSARTAVPDTTGLQPRRTVYLYTGALGVNVRFRDEGHRRARYGVL